jgi:mannose-1-phosphate guanylyltransferase
MEYVNNQPV